MISLKRLLVAGIFLLGLVTAGFAETRDELMKRVPEKIGHRDFDGAIADCTTVIAQDDLDIPAFSARGYARHAKGDFEGAIADYSRTIDLMWQTPLPDSARHKVELARTYANRGKARQDRQDWDGAIEDYAISRRVNPAAPEPYYLRGSARQAKGDLGGAASDFEALIQLTPDKPEGYQGRALIRSARGDYRGAIEDFRKVISLEARYVTYSHLFIWGLRTRLGEKEAADQELANYFAAPLADVQKGDWKSTVAEFLLGHLDENALMSAAKAPDPMQNRALLCEACYYRGMKRLLAGNRTGAAECFEQSLSTGMIYFTEYILARDELAALR